MSVPEQKICSSASNCSSDLLSANAKATLFLLTSSQHNALQQEQLAASQCLFPCAPGDYQRPEPKSLELGPPLILSSSNSANHGDSPLLLPNNGSSGPESGSLSPLEFGDSKPGQAKPLPFPLSRQAAEFAAMAAVALNLPPVPAVMQPPAPMKATGKPHKSLEQSLMRWH